MNNAGLWGTQIKSCYKSRGQGAALGWPAFGRRLPPDILTITAPAPGPLNPSSKQIYSKWLLNTCRCCDILFTFDVILPYVLLLCYFLDFIAKHFGHLWAVVKGRIYKWLLIDWSVVKVALTIFLCTTELMFSWRRSEEDRQDKIKLLTFSALSGLDSALARCLCVHWQVKADTRARHPRTLTQNFHTEHSKPSGSLSVHHPDPLYLSEQFL